MRTGLAFCRVGGIHIGSRAKSKSAGCKTTLPVPKHRHPHRPHEKQRDTAPPLLPVPSTGIHSSLSH